MDEEHDDNREREESAAAEMRAESENCADTEDGVTLEPPVPEEPVYTPEEYQLAQEIRVSRLFKEDKGRIPYTTTEIDHFLIKANLEHPIRPEEDDLKAARAKLAAAGS